MALLAQVKSEASQGDNRKSSFKFSLSKFQKKPPPDHGLRGRVGYSTEYLDSQKLPRQIRYSIYFICVLPILLNLFGVDFSSAKVPMDPEAFLTSVDHRFHIMGGAFTHALLEWAAFTVAILTVFLAFTHFAIKRDPATPIIAIALLSAGIMDAFHTLAATRLISATASNQDLIPFSWALCRLFNSLVCLIGVSIFLIRPKGEGDIKRDGKLIVGISLLFFILAYTIIHLCATSEVLPQTQFPEAIITRPWDLGPFFVFLATALVYVAFFKKQPSPFTYSLILSTVPDLAVQLHMAFGSSTLFDNHFNIAHFLKIIAYMVPFIGLAYEHVVTLREATSRSADLKKKNRELDDFTYIASHDLKEPLRGIKSNSIFLVEDFGSEMSEGVKNRIDRITSLANRMERLVGALLDYSKIEKTKCTKVRVDTNQIVSEVIDSMEILVSENNAQIIVQDLPKIVGDPVRIDEVFSNLISNGIKYNNKEKKIIEIGAYSVGSLKSGATDEVVFYVKDNGIGIPREHIGSVFKIFKRLHARNDFGGGTGAGLTIVKKIIEQHGGKIKINSKEDVGTTFEFSFGGSNDAKNT